MSEATKPEDHDYFCQSCGLGFISEETLEEVVCPVCGSETIDEVTKC